EDRQRKLSTEFLAVVRKRGRQLAPEVAHPDRRIVFAGAVVRAAGEDRPPLPRDRESARFGLAVQQSGVTAGPGGDLLQVEAAQGDHLEGGEGPPPRAAPPPRRRG